MVVVHVVAPPAVGEGGGPLGLVGHSREPATDQVEIRAASTTVEAAAAADGVSGGKTTTSRNETATPPSQSDQSGRCLRKLTLIAWQS